MTLPSMLRKGTLLTVMRTDFPSGRQRELFLFWKRTIVEEDFGVLPHGFMVRLGGERNK